MRPEDITEVGGGFLFEYHDEYAVWQLLPKRRWRLVANAGGLPTDGFHQNGAEDFMEEWDITHVLTPDQILAIETALRLNPEANTKEIIHGWD